jgi:Trypsin/FG-GAP-like repeat
MTTLFQHTRRSSGLLSFATLALVSACSGVEGSSDGNFTGSEFEDVGESVINGTPQDPWGVNPTDARGKSLIKIGGCSATLIDPEWVITAKHCGDDLATTNAVSKRSTGDVSRVIDATYAHPSVDIQLLHLATPFTDLPRVPLYSGTPASLDNKNVLIFGFGATAVGQACTTNADCDSTEYCHGGYKKCLTPSTVLRSATRPVTSSAATKFNLGPGTAGEATLPGDSGGPSFYGNAIAGVHSTGNGVTSTDASVLSVRDWALQTMNRAATTWNTDFSDANGWSAAKYYVSVDYPDVNKDGYSDVCGRGTMGVSCALSDGAKFKTATLWSSAFSDAGGWGDSKYYSSIRYPDLNADGRPDVCGRGQGGIWCALTNTAGTAFGAASVWSTAFSDANGWSTALYNNTLKFVDLNNDKKADVCARGVGGIYCAISTGTGFGAATVWSSFFSDANNWNNAKYASTVGYADVNTDGRLDVCGRSSLGIYCGISGGASFATPTLWGADYSDANGWGSVQHYSTILYGDYNGDSRADVCGRSTAGIMCSPSNGVKFGTPTTLTTLFSDATGGNQASSHTTLVMTDVDKDGKQEFCGRTASGAACAFGGADARVYASAFSDTGGWNVEKHYATFGFVDVDKDGIKDVCGRGSNGMWCAK